MLCRPRLLVTFPRLHWEPLCWRHDYNWLIDWLINWLTSSCSLSISVFLFFSVFFSVSLFLSVASPRGDYCVSLIHTQRIHTVSSLRCTKHARVCVRGSQSPSRKARNTITRNNAKATCYILLSPRRCNASAQHFSRGALRFHVAYNKTRWFSHGFCSAACSRSYVQNDHADFHLETRRCR